MTSLTANYLDGNAAAGELSKVFALDLTAAEGQCAHCGARKHFADAHVYMQSPGVVARCAACQHVLLRLVSVRQRVFLDLRGLTYLSLDTDQVQSSEFARSAA
jgi:NAD-dependent SIR2 family protein deacetylase